METPKFGWIMLALGTWCAVSATTRKSSGPPIATAQKHTNSRSSERGKLWNLWICEVYKFISMSAYLYVVILWLNFKSKIPYFLKPKLLSILRCNVDLIIGFYGMNIYYNWNCEYSTKTYSTYNNKLTQQWTFQLNGVVICPSPAHTLSSKILLNVCDNNFFQVMSWQQLFITVS